MTKKEKKTPGPDQAASWIIAAAAWVINTMLSGVSRGTGVFYVSLIEVYGIKRFEANMPFTLRNITRNLAGPIVGILGQKFGVRTITLIGGVFATVGIALCYISPNIIYICLFWGVFHGLGVALANTLFQVTVNQYFVKHRATAAGLALSGACIGSFFFPVTLDLFVGTYGVHGAFLLTSGLIMHVIPAALLLTEPPWLKQLDTKLEDGSLRNTKTKQTDDDKSIAVRIEPRPKLGSDKIIGNSSIEKILPEMSDSEKMRLSVDQREKHSSNVDITSPESIDTGVVNHSYVQSTLDMNENAFSGMVQSINFKTNNDTRKVSTADIKATITNDPEESKEIVKGSMFGALASVCGNPMFHMISFSLATYNLLFDPLLTVIMDYTNDKGFDDRIGKFLISVLAIGDLIGRLGFGWVTDKEFMTVGKFMVFTQVLQGLSICLFPMFYTFEVLMGLFALFGIASGMEIIMFPILVAKYLPDEQSVAIGCISFFGGLVSFAAPPLIGHFRDKAGSYDGMFYITGSLGLLSAFLWLFEPCIVKFCNKKVSSLDSLSK